MSKSDFFSFITSLKPIELKAIGELSHVIHLDEGVTVYSSGDPSDALYIINRGALAVIHEDPRYSDRADISYLGRGDMFGELEVLTSIPRRNAIRTCEDVSLQVFKAADFPELLRRVPSFFYYLAQRLSARLVQATDVAFVQSHCLELSGNLQNFDLITIYQTIVNSSQTGELVIFAENHEAIAVFNFVDGRPMNGQYYNLSGEEAFFQLLLHERMQGTFSFSISNEEQPDSGSPQDLILRSSTDLLITALQYRDEFRGMVNLIPDSSATLCPLREDFDCPEHPEHPGTRETALRIWELCRNRPLSVDDLFQQVQVCEVRLYRAILLLMDTGHFALTTPPPPILRSEVVPVRRSPASALN